MNKLRKIGVPRCALLALLAASMAGCDAGPAAPSTARVTGKVTYNGNPVANATVTFLPAAGGAAASESATTDDKGEFTVSGGSSRAGLRPGDYKIAVQAYKVPPHQIPPNELKEREESNRAVPMKYFSEQTSGLTVTISPADKSKTVPLELKDE